MIPNVSKDEVRNEKYKDFQRRVKNERMGMPLIKAGRLVSIPEIRKINDRLKDGSLIFIFSLSL